MLQTCLNQMPAGRLLVRHVQRFVERISPWFQRKFGLRWKRLPYAFQGFVILGVSFYVVATSYRGIDSQYRYSAEVSSIVTVCQTLCHEQARLGLLSRRQDKVIVRGFLIKCYVVYLHCLLTDITQQRCYAAA